jgi:hypothetical protein
MHSYRHALVSVGAALLAACGGKDPGSGADPSLGRNLQHDNLANWACKVGECEPSVRRAPPVAAPLCPSDEPQLAEICAIEGATCTYGMSLTADCRRFYRCEGAVWVIPPPGRQPHCASQPTGFCLPEPSPGLSCVVGDVDSYIPCQYGAGVGCYCIGSPFGVSGAPGHWECYGPPSNSDCPEVLPNVGDGCEPRGQFCAYGLVKQGCASPYAEVYCYDGAWEASGSDCAD